MVVWDQGGSVLESELEERREIQGVDGGGGRGGGGRWADVRWQGGGKKCSWTSTKGRMFFVFP